MDADNGHIVLGDQDGYVFLFDTNTGTGSPIAINVGFYDVQIMYVPQ